IIRETAPSCLAWFRSEGGEEQANRRASPVMDARREANEYVFFILPRRQGPCNRFIFWPVSGGEHLESGREIGYVTESWQATPKLLPKEFRHGPSRCTASRSQPPLSTPPRSFSRRGPAAGGTPRQQGQCPPAGQDRV